MINHEKAKKLYEEHDPYKEALEMLTSQIHAAAAPGGSSLKSIISGIGSNFAYEEVEDAICALEAIYEVLQKEQNFIEKKIKFKR
ncbi:hypothetical protein [Candidatus Tisiphia endosymbiont of Oplodontha viridula]|uniref:hypothetical protein n=1 Tax=Candidatus Tisiphia endosymbiont of Oplodontha viridula TaxID=3077925 RepID=UPI0035C8A063